MHSLDHGLFFAVLLPSTCAYVTDKGTKACACYLSGCPHIILTEMAIQKWISYI